jgi:hypothetical protein
VHRVGQSITNVFVVNEPFLPSMCTAPYDREKHCLRAVDVVTTMQERLSYAGRFDVVAQLAPELEARRLAGRNVVRIDESCRGRTRRSLPPDQPDLGKNTRILSGL